MLDSRWERTIGDLRFFQREVDWPVRSMNSGELISMAAIGLLIESITGELMAPMALGAVCAGGGVGRALVEEEGGNATGVWSDKKKDQRDFPTM